MTAGYPPLWEINVDQLNEEDSKEGAIKRHLYTVRRSRGQHIKGTDSPATLVLGEP